MTRIGIILDSTRPNRNGEKLARWVLEQDFENYETLQPKPFHEATMSVLFDQLIARSNALVPLRRQTALAG